MSDSESKRQKSEVSTRFEYIDVFRGIACLAVYFYHHALNLKIGDVPIFGYQGVHLFFVISGFLLGGRYVQRFIDSRPLPKTRLYLRSRFLRIYPPYFICLSLFIFLRIASGVNPPSIGNCVARYLLIFNYVDRYDYFSINAVFWTLAVEMQFYLLLPIWVWLVCRICYGGFPRAIVFSFGAVLIGLFFRWFEISFIDHDHADAIAEVRFKWVLSHLDMFGVGFIAKLAEVGLDRFSSVVRNRVALLMVPVGLVLLYSASRWARDSGNWQSSNSTLFVLLSPLITCAAFALVILGVGQSVLSTGWLFKQRCLTWVGVVSYSFYLYHSGIQFFVGKIIDPGSWGWSWTACCSFQAVVGLPPALVVSWLAYRFVEQPFQDIATKAKSVPQAQL